MGVPYNIIMVGFEWAANQKKVTRGKKYCLIWYAKQKKMQWKVHDNLVDL